MPEFQTKQSRDGFMWTPSGGRVDGLPSIGVIHPPSQVATKHTAEVHDAIVIGAGYAGLVAARDLATQGKNVLLLEGRDRIGGRSWNATIDGGVYEIGGTWLHWQMPHIYREISLYGLHNDWVVTQTPGAKEAYTTLTYGSEQRNLTPQEAAEMFSRVWSLFCNLDGDHQRQSWKYVFGTGQSPELLAKWDKLTCQDRFDQIKNQLSKEEQAMLIGVIRQMGGSSLERMGLVNALHWWTLGQHTPFGLNDIALHTRLGSGNSTLQRRMFDHAKSTGNLSYSFNTAVKSVQEVDGIVTVTSRTGQSWKAKAIICTVPLNVLSTIQFSPPLPADKQVASRQTSVNLCNKVHVDVEGKDWLSWESFATPGKGLISMFGDRLTPGGNTHMVAFGPDPNLQDGITLNSLDVVKDSVMHLIPENKRKDVVLNRIVSHDWVNDEFSKGTWCFLPPGATTEHLEALQRPHGKVLFASADWSDGWRGWIDGAVHIGANAAHQVLSDQNGFKIGASIKSRL